MVNLVEPAAARSAAAASLQLTTVLEDEGCRQDPWEESRSKRSVRDRVRWVPLGTGGMHAACWRWHCSSLRQPRPSVQPRLPTPAPSDNPLSGSRKPVVPRRCCTLPPRSPQQSRGEGPLAAAPMVSELSARQGCREDSLHGPPLSAARGQVVHAEVLARHFTT